MIRSSHRSVLRLVQSYHRLFKGPAAALYSSNCPNRPHSWFYRTLVTAAGQYGRKEAQVQPWGLTLAMGAVGGAIAGTFGVIAIGEAQPGVETRWTDTLGLQQGSSLEKMKKEQKRGALGKYAIAEAVEKVSDAVVNIRLSWVAESDFLVRMFEGRHFHGGEFMQSSGASGFIFDENGLVMTNAHVVAQAMEGSVKLEVVLKDGRVFEGQVVVLDTSSDIAVVKIESPRPLPVAKLGCSDDTRVGEWAIAVGSPLTLSDTVTLGIVSTVKRDLNRVAMMPHGRPPIPGAAGLTYIQTDAAINAGNSGGPLINIEGEVIGINSMKVVSPEYMGIQGISFAIPIDHAKRVIQELQEHGKPRFPYIGLLLVPLTPDVIEDMSSGFRNRKLSKRLKQMAKESNKSEIGLLIHDVTKGGPAAAASLEAGDIITNVDGASTATVSEFLAETRFKAGKHVELTVLRASTGKSEKVSVRLGVRESEGKESPSRYGWTRRMQTFGRTSM